MNEINYLNKSLKHFLNVLNPGDRKILLKNVENIQHKSYFRYLQIPEL
jgi:hypothetical protein